MVIEQDVIEFVAAADWTDDCRVRVELKKRVATLTISQARALADEITAAATEAEKAAESAGWVS
ncbi:hypothetical protein [Microbacterium sp. YY-01]|uniref:hypothetical protein n=1 Tax=Microbacterium sp. YY-01 TaxID=3421634 RepID=UPI003D16CCCE